MKSRNDNIEFILSKAGEADDLKSVIIDKTFETAARCVSNDDLLAVALAVDDEIARQEYANTNSENLIELYRIRYECANRIMSHLINDGVDLNCDYGMALRAYVFTHIDGNKNEIKKLKDAEVFPVSLPEVVTDYLVNVPNPFNRALLYYALSYFKTNSNYKVNADRYTGIGLRYHRHIKKGEIMDFSVVDGDPIMRDEMNENFNPPVRDEMDIKELQSNFFDGDELNVDNLEFLNDEIKDGFKKIISLFDSPGSFISREDIEAKEELKVLLSKDGEQGWFGKIKPGVAVLKYHEEMKKYENEMNTSKGSKHEGWQEWKNKWSKLAKYAHTSPEYLPNFIEKLEAMDEFLSELQQAVLANKNISMKIKSKYLVAIIQAKAAVAKERELVCESMLARLEILGAETMLAIDNGNNKDNAFYANIVHAQYNQYRESMGGDPVKIEEKSQRKDLKRKTVAEFKNFIDQLGTSDQKSRLQKLFPDVIVKVEDNTDREMLDSYINLESTPVDHVVVLPYGNLNLDDLALNDYESREQLQNNEEKMEKLRNEISRLRKDEGLDNVKVEITENQLEIFQIIESASKDQAYTAYYSFCKSMTDDPDKYSDKDKEFFMKLLAEKFYPNMEYKSLFIKIINSSFESLEDKNTFNQFVEMYLKFDGHPKRGDLLFRLSRIESSQNMKNVLWEIDANNTEGDVDAIFNFIVQLDSMIDEYNLTDQYIDDMVSDINDMNNVKSATEKLLEDHHACENGNKIFDRKMNCFVDVRKNMDLPPLLETEEVVPVQSQPEASPTRPWWKTALIGAGIGLFAVGVAVAGLALGIPALLVTTAAAIVIGAVAGAAMLIGFGIGAIVGKVREKQEQRQHQYAPVGSHNVNSPGQSPSKYSSNNSDKKLSMNGKGATKNNAGSSLWNKPQQGENQNNNNKPDSQPKFKN